MRRSGSHGLWLAVLLTVLLLAAQLSPPSSRGQNAPEGAVQRAWGQAQQAGRYGFVTDVVQTTHPAPSLASVGQPNLKETLHLEGQADLPTHFLSLTLWKNAGSVLSPGDGLEMRIDGDRAFGRVSGGNWQEVDDFSGVFAPGQDMLSYLAGIKNVAELGSETRALPGAEQNDSGDSAQTSPPASVTFTRYRFDVDGPRLSEYISAQMERQLRERGQLPPGLTLELAGGYRDVIGQGEVWIDARGLPLRLTLHVEYPEDSKGQRVEVDIRTDFRFTDAAAVAVGSSSIQTLLSALARARPSLSSALALWAMGLFVVVLLRSWRSRRIYAAVAILLILSMVGVPLLQVERVVAFTVTQAARQAQAQQRQNEAEATRQVQDKLLGSTWNPHADPLTSTDLSQQARQHGTEANAQDAEPAPDSDQDGDGLTREQELVLGMNPDDEDTDHDGITDDVELAGFTFNHKEWYTDPTNADTNSDSLIDMIECPEQVRSDEDSLSPAGRVCRDTDGDLTPDIFDRDNDNDGVPDRVDLSPFGKMYRSDGSAFDASHPLTLQIDQLQANEPVYVDLQLRPENLNHLSYAFNVFDWPSGDTQGQIRRAPGNDSTFESIPQGGAEVVADGRNGDMRLVPMLEILIPYKEGHYGNLPVRADAPITRTQGMTLGQWLDTEKLDPFGIFVQDLNDDGDLAAYVPLNLVADETGSDRVAFAARMLYWPTQTVTNSTTADWGNTHQVRMVWLVQMLTDRCKTPPGDLEPQELDTWCDDPDNWEVIDEPRVVHSYGESWYVTGLDVREDHGLQVAIINEDPRQEPTDRDRMYDDWLWVLAHGLDGSFLAGRDEDGDDLRDITVNEIQHRWDNASNAGTTNQQRWSVPITATQVTTFTYEHESFVAQIMMTETKKILDDVFTPYVDHGSDAPTLLFAQEAYYRGANLDEGGSTARARGDLLTMALDPENSKLNAKASLSWAPYRYRGGEWESYPIAEYWDHMSVRFADIFPEYRDDEDYPDILRGQVYLAQTHYVTVYCGRSAVVQIGDDIIHQPEAYQHSDEAMINWIEGAAWTESGGGITIEIYTLADGVCTLVEELSKGFFKALGQALFGTLSKAELQLKNASVRWEGSKFNTGMGLLSLGLLVVGVWAAKQGSSIVMNIVNGAYLVMSAIGTTLLAFKIYKAMRGSWAALCELSEGRSGKAGTVGIIIGILVTWGCFIAMSAISGVKFLSMAFNAALASAIASTIAMLILLAISMIPFVGTIIFTVIGLLDCIALFFCGLFELDHWACKGVSGWITEGITWFIYSGQVMVNLGDSKRMEMTGFEQQLADAVLGLALGQTLVISTTVENTVKLITWADTRYDWKAGAYWWQYSTDRLRDSTFRYHLQTSPDDHHSGLTLGTARDYEWDPSDDDHASQYVWEESDAAKVTLTQTGINRPLQLYLTESYAVPAQECWVIPPPIAPVPIPVCYVRTEKGSTHGDLSKSLTYDVFPATLDTFCALVSKDGGQTLAWSPNSSPTFPRQKDADGDGLRNPADGGADPDDSRWDKDSDGLSDYYELQKGSNPSLAHSDTDGLTDHEEAVLGLNPSRNDSDYDGLTDAEELEGWDFVYGFDADGEPVRAWVTSDPTSMDGDGDGFTDFQEKVYGFHPRVPSDPNLLKFESTLTEPDAPRLLLRLDQVGGATAFADSSGFGRAGTCAGDACPAAGHYGKYESAASFDGTDDYIRVADDAALDPDMEMSIAAWVRLNNPSADQCIAGKVEGSRGYALRVSGAQLRTQVWDTAGSEYGGAAGTISADAWTHVAMTWKSGGSLYAYVNGIQVGSWAASASPVGSGDSPLVIGAAPWNVTLLPADGRIDEVALFDRALSASEIGELMAGRYNPSDLTVAPGDRLQYDASMENQLLDRHAQGVLSTHFPEAFASSISPVAFVLNPQELQGISGTLQVKDSATSGTYRLRQEADAQINNWREASDDAEVRLHLDETAGTTFADSSGQRPPRDGTCSGASCPTLGVPGAYGTALSFDGIDDRVTIERGKIGRELTLAAWVELDALPTSVMRFITLPNEKGVLRYQNQQLDFYVKAGGALKHLQVTAALTQTGTYYHVAGVCDGATLRAYVNGQLMTPTLAISGTIADTEGATLSGASEALNGQLDEVMLFNRALSHADIEALYNRPALRLALDEASGATRFKDESGMGNDGTCSGSACPAAGQTQTLSGKSVHFDGVNDLISVDTLTADLNSGAYSVGGFFRMDKMWDRTDVLFSFNTSTNADRAIVAVQGLTETLPGGGIGARPESEVLYWDTALGEVRSGHILHWESWHHIMLVVEQDNSGHLYVDGDEAVTFDTAVRPQSSDRFSLGQEWDPGSSSQHYMGHMDNVVAHNFALSARQVQEAYESSKSLYLRFEDAPGSTYFVDSSGGDAGTCSSPRCPTGGVGGRITQGAYFDGVDDRVVVPDSDRLMPTDEFTLAAWVKLEEPATDQKIISKMVGNRGYVLGVANGKLYPEVWDRGAARYSAQWGTVPANRWTHLAFTWQSGGDMIGYINGQEVGRIAASANPVGYNAMDLRIGVASWNESAFQVKGIVDEVVLQAHALDAAGIKHLYDSAPWFLLHFDEESGVTAFRDDSDHGRDVACSGNYCPKAGAKGQLGLAAQFDGRLQRLDIPNDEPVGGSGGDSFTIAGWFRFDQATTKNVRLVAIDGDAAVLYSQGPDLCFKVHMAGPSYWPTICASGVFQPGYYYHLAGTWEHGVDEMALYVNGEEAGRRYEPEENWLVYSNNLALGKVFVYGEQCLPGRMDDVAIYHIALSASEIRRQFREGARWIEERQYIEVKVDSDAPSVAVQSSDPYRPNEAGLLLVSASDATSPISMVELGASANGGTSYIWGSATLCQHAGTAPTSGKAFEETSWCASFEPTIGEGSYLVQARATDNTGQQTTTSPYTLLVDATPPQATVALTPGTVLRPSPHPSMEKAWLLTLAGPVSDPLLVSGQAGSGPAGVNVRLTDTGAPTASVGIQSGLVAGTSWQASYVLKAADPTGTYTIALQSRDRVGNVGSFGDVQTIGLDTRPPEVSLDRTLGTTDTITTTITLTGLVTETGGCRAGIAGLEIGFVRGGTTAPDYWLPCLLSAAGPGVTTATWSFVVPSGLPYLVLDGIYEIYLRASDVLGNVTAETLYPTRWRGEIDTQPPAAELWRHSEGEGLATVGYYTCWAQDFNLYERTDPLDPTPLAYDMICPCQFVAPDSTVYERQYYHEFDDWYRETLSDTVRLYRMTVSCTQPGLPLLGYMSACDRHGHCSVVTPLPLSGLDASAAATPAKNAGWSTELLESAVLTPTAGSVLTSTSAVSVTVGAYAANGLRKLTFTVDGAPVISETWGPGITGTLWSTTWNPVSEGIYILSSVAEDHSDNVQATTYPMTVTVDTQAPEVGLTGVVTTAHWLSMDRAMLTGPFTDSVGVDEVTVSVAGGPWQSAALIAPGPTPPMTGTWALPWYIGDEPDGGAFTVTVRAADRAAHTAEVTGTVLVDLARPTSVTLTMTSAGTVISAAHTLRTISPTLVLTWTQSSDGAGLDSYRAGFTASGNVTGEQWSEISPLGMRLVQYTAGEAEEIYGHVACLDTNGNRGEHDYGPVYVDSPFTPDFVTLPQEPEDISVYRGWMDGGCALLGVDRRIAESAQDGATPRAEQKLYATWDSQALRLAWTGANPSVHGDIWVYLDTQSGGGPLTLNPYLFTPTTLVWLPGQITGSLQMQADYLVWVRDAATAMLWNWNDTLWVSNTLLSPLQYRFEPGLQGGQIDLYLPFAQIGITEPVSSSLQLLSFATEDNAMRLWAALPTNNSLSSDRVVQTGSYAGDERSLLLVSSYQLPSLAANLCPNGIITPTIPTPTPTPSTTPTPTTTTTVIPTTTATATPTPTMPIIPTITTTSIPTPTTTEIPIPTTTEIPIPTITGIPTPTTTEIPVPTITDIPIPTITGIPTLPWPVPPAGVPPATPTATPPATQTTTRTTTPTTIPAPSFRAPPAGSEEREPAEQATISDLAWPSFGDSDVRIDILPSPQGATYSFIQGDLFWLWPQLFQSTGTFGPKPPNLVETFDFLDGEQPPLGDGQEVWYTVQYANRGTQTAHNVHLEVSSFYALRLPDGAHLPLQFHDQQSVVLGDIAAGASGSSAFRGRVDVAATRIQYYTPCLVAPAPLGSHDVCDPLVHWASLLVLVYDDSHPASGPPVDWIWVDHEVDSDAPHFVGLFEPETLVSAHANELNGYGYNTSGVPTVTVQTTGPLGTIRFLACTDATPEDGLWQCDWDAAAANGGWAPSDGGVFQVQLMATDSVGQASGWVNWGTWTVDAVSPTVNLDEPTTLAYSETLVAGSGMSFHGAVNDNRGIGTVELCLNDDCANTAVQAEGVTARSYDDVPGTPIAINASVACSSGGITRTFVVDEHFAVGEVRLGFNANHTDRDDINVSLRSPLGTVVQVLGHEPGASRPYDNVDVLLYDAAAADQHAHLANDNPAEPYFDREARPLGPTTTWRGQDAFGTWTLTICDADPAAGNGTYNLSRLSLKPQAMAVQTGTWLSNRSVIELVDDEPFTLTVATWDAVGNHSFGAQELHFRVDNVSPLITVELAYDEVLVNSNLDPVLVLSGTVTDGGWVSMMHAYMQTPEGELRAGSVGHDGDEWWFNLEPRPPGHYTVWIVAKDEAGNETTAGPYEVIAYGGDLSISKAMEPDPAQPNAPLTYTISYINAGPGPVRDVWITDTLPAGVVFGGQVSAPSGWTGPSVAGQTLSWYTPTLEADDPGAMVFTTTVSLGLVPADWTLPNHMEITGTGELDSTDNAAVLPGTLQGLTVSKMHVPANVKATTDFQYYIYITNTAGSAATNVTITDTLPVEIDPDSVQPSAGGTFDGTDTVTWTLASLGPGSSQELWIQARFYSEAVGLCPVDVVEADSVQAAPVISATDTVCVASAQGLSYVGDIGMATIKDSSTADLVVTTTAAVEAGDDIIIAYATDPTDDLTISISDSASNQYQQATMAINVGNLRTYVFAAYHVNALSSGSSITITQTVVGSPVPEARAAVVSVFRGLAPVGALEQTSVSSGSGTTPSSGAATTVRAQQLLIGGVGTEGPSGDAAGTWADTFAAGPRAGTTGDADDTNTTVSMGWRIVNAAGDYAAAKGSITSRDWAAAIATFKTTAAGISYIGGIGTAQSNPAGTSLVITTTAAVVNGDDIMIAFAADEEGTVSSVVDSAGNTYNQVVTATNTGNVLTTIFAAYNVNAFASGRTITITHSLVTARTAVVSVFRGLADSGALDQIHTDTGNTSAPSSGATGSTAQADELLIGAVGTEGPHGDAPSVWLNSFTGGPRLGTHFGSTGGDDTSVTIALGWRIVGITGAYVAQLGDLGTTRDWAAAIATFKSAPPTAVRLTSFTVEAGRGRILLAWDTTAELDILGFHVYRATGQHGPRERLTASPIPSQAPGSPSGAHYRFVDEAVQPGLTYYYWLQQVEVNGATELYGPISARVALDIKPTPTRN